MAEVLEEIGHAGVSPAPLMVSGPAFVYCEHPPPTALRDTILRVWRSNVEGGTDQRLRLVPDGCVELSYSCDRHMLVFGATSSWSDLVLPAGRQFEGARLSAGSAAAVLGVDARDLEGLVLAGCELPLLKALVGVPPETWLSSLCSLVEDRQGAFLDDRVASIAPQRIIESPTLSLAVLARSLGVGERQLRRRFEQAVGLPPATFRRIVRMQRAVAAHRNRPTTTWTTIAHDHGYADQAHLTRDVTEFTGCNPTTLSTRHPGEHPGAPDAS